MTTTPTAFPKNVMGLRYAAMVIDVGFSMLRQNDRMRNEPGPPRCIFGLPSLLLGCLDGLMDYLGRDIESYWQSIDQPPGMMQIASQEFVELAVPLR